MKNFITFGEIMLRLSPPGMQRFGQARSFDAGYGGGESNVAVSLSHFGFPTQFVTRLPSNDLGEACLQFRRRRNRCRLTTSNPECATIWAKVPRHNDHESATDVRRKSETPDLLCVVASAGDQSPCSRIHLHHRPSYCLARWSDSDGSVVVSKQCGVH